MTATKTTKQNLIDVAIPLMAEHGVYGISLRDIAKKAEINVSSVLYHFGSKEEFIRTCGEFCVQQLCAQIKDIASRSYENLNELTLIIQESVEKTSQQNAIIIMLLTVDSSGFREIYEKYVTDDTVKINGNEQDYILNLRSFISLFIFKRVDLKIANSKLDSEGMVELLCEQPTVQ